MEGVFFRLKMTVCPHCGKAISVGKIETVQVSGEVLADRNRVVCPRPECGGLLGYISINYGLTEKEVER